MVGQRPGPPHGGLPPAIFCASPLWTIMPHVTLEYSTNLEQSVLIEDMCAHVLDAVIATGVFEQGAVRVRAVRCQSYAIADRDPRNAFVDGALRMGSGRDPDTRRRVGEAVFGALRGFLAERFEDGHFALSFEIREIDPDLSFKENTMHRRLAGDSAAN